MLRRLVNLPFAVATRAARAFQEREDAKAREKYGATQDPGALANTREPPKGPTVHSTLDPAAVRMDAAAVRGAQGEGRNVVIVDIRERQVGEGIPGALHMPLSEVSTRVSELSDDQLVAAWADDDHAATQAVLFFRERGIEDAWVMPGGLPRWKAAGGPVEVA
ncbi:MAG: rhodanese-like domain-containing protein [Pseudomonadota bacterium]|nr:rhodanese-like domain-containing protein [Pseudomonadota bacterium]